MKKFAFLLFGVFSYLAFLWTILYAIGFTGNMVVEKTIDSQTEMPRLQAIFIDVCLLSVFALQHSVMARPAFKSWWTKIIPVALERSTYVLLASLCLMLLMWQWQPIGGIVWSVENDAAKTILLIAYMSGWSIVFVSTFLINHFDLFGLRQTWYYFKGKKYSVLAFRLPGFYQMVRHPLYLGFLIAFWSAPLMTVAHLIFASITTIYILVAIQFEEKDLVTDFGEKYLSYKKWAPMLIPFTKKKTANK